MQQPKCYEKRKNENELTAKINKMLSVSDSQADLQLNMKKISKNLVYHLSEDFCFYFQNSFRK